MKAITGSDRIISMKNNSNVSYSIAVIAAFCILLVTVIVNLGNSAPLTTSNTAAARSGLNNTSPTRCTASSPEAPIYVVMGQSNAYGVGKVSLLPTTPQTTTVLADFASAGWPFQYWYKNDTAWSSGSVIQTAQGNYFGPDLMIASRLISGGLRNFYIFKYAIGGTFLATGHAPYSWGSRGTGGIYDSAVAKLNAAKDAICNTGKYPVVKAMFWMQGEADATDVAAALAYRANLTRLVNQSREDFLGSTAPFVLGLVDNYVTGLWPYAAVVRAAQRLAVASTSQTAYVETNDLPLYPADCATGIECDAHYTTVGQYGLGTRFYSAYLSLAPAPVIVQPSITSFTASPTRIVRGGSVMLSWSAQNASYCWGAGTGPSNRLPVMSSVTVSPGISTYYSLVCVNSVTGGSSATSTVYVDVNAFIHTSATTTATTSIR